ncbi:hypothetical protein [Sulfobacillus harzensis]|uniref:Tail specific protease domain-containing protein n=1 Tax=Sulfobacillus harzensis TaxID=2729629 RepID=A0A7Y0L4E3_9FIRM|nr:hypothetical protein [Sulfobacillus harzensis]NMP23106.1 hypothetical protein [Sulfobacillus harzensis]
MNIPALTKKDMQADLEYLVQLLVESHPDPFAGAGGAVNFYRLVDEITRALPDHLGTPDYLRLLRPLVAALRDGHTTLHEMTAVPSRHLAIGFDVLADGLVIGRVYSPGFRPLVGARLEAVNDVPVDQLATIVERLWGCDNEIHIWCRLADALEDSARLAEVLMQPESSRVTLALRTADGIERQVPVHWLKGPRGSGWAPSSAVAVPPVGPTQIGWGFADNSHHVAVLRVGRLTRYREAAEVWWHSGYHNALRNWYRELYPDTEPTDAVLQTFVSEVPAATPILIECLDTMARTNTPWLVVDLTESTGGNSVLANMLGWALFGPEALRAVDGGYQIPRYSPLYAQNYGQVPEGDWGPGGYDFSAERAWRVRHVYGMREQPAGKETDEWLTQIPTFQKAAQDLPGWRPRVVVVTSARTYSAGFDILLTLKGLGAHHVGVPSAQAPNCFIDILRFTLPHSELAGTVSFKRSMALPQLDPQVRHLEPDVALTYDELRAYQFDPAAGVRFALDAIRSGRWQA